MLETTTNEKGIAGTKQKSVDLFSGIYKNYAEELYQEIRKETFGEDIGQNSWLTADEYRKFFSVLNLRPGKKVLEIASGSGGPAVFLVNETGCDLTGIDVNENGIGNSKKLALKYGLHEKMNFILGDAARTLPFADETFDVVISVDSINHLNNRPNVFSEFRRVLKKGGRLLFTDAVVVTGVLTNEEIAVRSSLGFFLFSPAGENERLLQQAGFRHVRSKDVTENVASVSWRWFISRQNRRAELLQFEDEENYYGLQSFFSMVYTLSSEKRLSRFMYTAKK